MAATATGVPVNHVSANDGGVWLTNDNPGSGFRGTFADYNAPIKQLGYTFGAPGASPQPSYDLDVLQEGTTVLAIDRLQGALYAVNSQSGSTDATGSVRFPIGSQLALGGEVGAILQPATAATPARLWAAPVGSGPVATLAGLNTTTAKPILQVSGGSAVAVDGNGDVFVTTRTELVTLAFTGSGFKPAVTTKFAEPLASVALTAVGATPAILDASTGTVYFPTTGIATSLPASTRTGRDLRLQQAGPADASVLVATNSGLVSVPVSGHAPSVLATVSSGRPADPVRLDGCAYDAWAGNPAEVAQVCESGVRNVGPLPGIADQVAALEKPVLRVNHDQIVLNDAADGNTWTIIGRPSQVLGNQDWVKVLVGSNVGKTSSAKSASSLNQQQEKQQPKLDNPTLYARAGRDSILHVLDNDSDPGGSILSIVGVSPASGPGFSVRVTPDTQNVVLSLEPGVLAPVHFDYQVVDGFGMTATGPVTVVPTGQETPPSPPVTATPPRPVVSGGTVGVQVLADWRDAESDPTSLVDASVPSDAGTVTWTSDGVLTFKAASVAADTITTVTYRVTDGRSAPVSGESAFRILGRGDVNAYPPTGVPDAVKVLVNSPTAFSPLANDVAGADPIDPSAKLALAGPVESATGLSIATNLHSGQLTLTAAQAGTYSIRYEASYGSPVSASTQILVQAVDPAGTVQPPVASPQSILLHGQYPETVDVLADDYDPAGGLLTVVGATAPAGLQATVIQGEYIRIAAATSDPGSNQLITYQVTNGRTDPVTGQVDVVWEPASTPLPPVVPDIYATVRAGDEVDIPVLSSASDPDGESVHALSGGAPRSVTVSQTNPGPSYPTGVGSASVSGDFLRYSAPAGTRITTAESVTISYVVESQGGQRTTGETYVTVIPNAPVSTAPPEPSEVDARVTAGGTVTIPIPTTGVDPNGDSVSVIGITSAARLGGVLSYNANSITYQAFPLAAAGGTFSGGTDSFNYEVEGPSGLTAQALVRVGISPPAQVQPPVAVDHFVTAAPGGRVQVDLLSGDYIAPGDNVTVEDLSKTNSPVPAGTALLGPERSILEAPSPTGPVPTSVAYGIDDGTTAPSVAHVLIHSQPGYVTPPVASDYYPAAPAPRARSITVNVLRNDSDPGGTPGDLRIAGSPVLGVQVAGPNLSIPVAPDPRAVPYVVRSSATGATAVGVVHVLGTSMGPRLRKGASIHVPENGSTNVNIDNYVIEPDHQIRLTVADQVASEPSGGLGERVTGNTTVRLTGLAGYVGPASLTVQVIDSSVLSEPGARTATFSIPVVVGNPTPVVRCPSTPLTVVPTGPPVNVTIASVCQVWTSDGSTPASVDFTERWTQPAPGVSLGWRAGEAGHVIALVAGSGARGGATGTISVGVAGAGQAAGSTLTVEVVEPPLPRATPATAPPVEAGHTVTVDMAQYVTSSLARPTIDVTALKQTSGTTSSATPSGSVVRITPAADSSGTITYAVAVSDQGPNRPDRVVNDTITVQVLGKPDAPTALQGVPGNHQVALTWAPSQDNGSPVEYYTVSTGASSERAGGTSYTWTGLNNSQPYTFTVTAVNGVGMSTPSAPASFTPRAAPDAPTAVTAIGGNQQATVSWAAANAEGSPIMGYTVFVSPSPGGPTNKQAGPAQTSLTWTGLNNSIGPYTFTVVAQNGVGPSPVSTASNAVYAHGVPATPPAPTASAQVSTDQTSTTVVVSWPAINNCNDAQPCAGYTVNELKNGKTAATNSTTSVCSGSVLCATFGPITNDGSSYSYTLTATNVEGQASLPSPSSTPAIAAVGAPGQVTNLAATAGDTKISLSFTLPASNASSITQVKYTLTGGPTQVNGAWSSPGATGQTVSEAISGLVNGTTYSVTVSACNASECGANSNAATADPYGPPNPPSVSASPSGTSIVYSWSGGGNNGRPVADYQVCIDGNCTSRGASPGTTSVSYQCVAPPGTPPHSIYASVTDSAGQTSANSATESASRLICPNPGPPTVSASASGNNITWSWNGGGGSGLPISYYELCVVNGSCSNVGPNPGLTTQGFACGTTHSAYAYVVDSAGQASNQSNTASATTAACPQPPPTTYTEYTVNPNGAPTFTNPVNASGQGPNVPANTLVQVTCKLGFSPGGTIASAFPDGYWYKIASAPWNNQYWAVANVFWNGGLTINEDPNVPNC